MTKSGSASDPFCKVITGGKPTYKHHHSILYFYFVLPLLVEPAGPPTSPAE